MSIVEQLHNKKVLTKDKIEVGYISGAIMDDEWTITHLHLALNTESTHKLGHIKPVLEHVTLCLPVNIIENNDETIRLTKNLEELKVLPECKTK